MGFLTGSRKLLCSWLCSYLAGTPITCGTRRYIAFKFAVPVRDRATGASRLFPELQLRPVERSRREPCSAVRLFPRNFQFGVTQHNYRHGSEMTGNSLESAGPVPIL